MEYGEKFKKAMFGFDRQDVLRCLEEMQQQSHQEQEKLRAELEALRQQRDGLQARVKTLTDTLEIKGAALETAEARGAAAAESLRQAEARCEALQRELSAQKALNTELLMKKNVLEENCRRLTTENEQLMAKNQELAGQIDERASLAIGELMVEAKVNANRIVNRAREQAAQSDEVIRAQCEGADMRISELQARLAKAVESFKQMSVAAVQSMEQISSELSDCRASIQSQIPSNEAPSDAPDASQAPEEPPVPAETPSPEVKSPPKSDEKPLF